MIDDLVTKGVSEPYRMFTSRAEYRLTLRADNADLRLTPLGQSLGLVGHERSQEFETRAERLHRGLELARSLSLTSAGVLKHGFRVNQDGLRRDALELMSVPEVGWEGVCRIWPQLLSLEHDTIEALEADALYAGYIDRQRSDIAAMKKEEQLRLPDSLDYGNMPSLSAELRQKLLRVRPATLGQASRIDGMTPAALAVVLSHVRRGNRKTAA